MSRRPMKSSRFASSPFSSEGSSGAFGGGSSSNNRGTSDSFHDTRHRFASDSPRWTRSSLSSPGRNSQDRHGAYFFVAVLVLGSLWLPFSLYGDQSLEMGQQSSVILKANSLFVKAILVRGSMLSQGADLYGFAKPPALGSSFQRTEEHNIKILGHHHHEWALWLNKGSKIHNELIGPESYHGLVFVIIQGQRNLHSWIDNPSESDAVLTWRAVLGNSSLEFEATSDDAYYFAFGNHQQREVQVKLLMHINSTLYITDGAFSVCHLTEFCSVRLSFLGTNTALVTTPEQSPGGMEVWHVRVTYRQRWEVYCIIYGVTLCAVLFSLSYKRRSSPAAHNDHECSPLVSTHAKSTSDQNFSSDDQTDSTSVSLVNQDNRNAEQNDCVICYDKSRDSFFSPCGHCATCYTCGLRMKEGRDPRCPICRQLVKTINKLYIC